MGCKTWTEEWADTFKSTGKRKFLCLAWVIHGGYCNPTDRQLSNSCHEQRGGRPLKLIKMVHSSACWYTKMTTRSGADLLWKTKAKTAAASWWVLPTTEHPSACVVGFQCLSPPAPASPAPHSCPSHLVHNLWKFLDFLSLARIPPAAAKTSSIFLHLGQTVLWRLKKIRIDNL